MRQTDTETDREADRESRKGTDAERGTETQRQTERHSEREEWMHIEGGGGDRETETDTQTDTPTVTDRRKDAHGEEASASSKPRGALSGRTAFQVSRPPEWWLCSLMSSDVG